MVFDEVSVLGQVGLYSSKGLTGSGGSTSKVDHSHGWRVWVLALTLASLLLEHSCLNSMSSSLLGWWSQVRARDKDDTQWKDTTPIIQERNGSSCWQCDQESVLEEQAPQIIRMWLKHKNPDGPRELTPLSSFYRLLPQCSVINCPAARTQRKAI